MTSAPSSPKARQGHVRGQERQGQGQETRTRQGQESEQDGESCSLSCKEGEVSDETPTDTAVSGSQEPGRGNPFVEPEISCFWTTLVRDITEKQAWRVKAFDDSSERLLDAYSEDEERIRMKHRRDAALKLRADPGRWSRLVLAGLRELAADAAGPGTAAIVRTGLLHAFQDFATHIRYFQITRGLMEAAGMAVPLTANASSSVHDVDKLDPVMLAGYCERWEDVRDTALWHACLEYHYAINTHHQQNELWHMEEGETKEEQCCRALPELLCDKASRKLQKELNGVVSSTMWSVETQFYLGIPDKWFDRALEMAASLASCRKIHQTNT
ncbi:uncharacterized protein [Dermacentor andersoni]|uniref:uncharacterized protein isoform X2 n=1 Tax=Dermacentor andersoni TaxID=34620 RepID=UPI0024164DC9|nr:uncharacterized protein LOC126531703 isoform X2 [Dermacentor andersoni]